MKFTMTINTPPRRRLSSSAREALYDRCRGTEEFPTCNICGLPVNGVHQAWDESHDPDGPPHCFGGTVRRSSGPWTPRPPVTAKSTSGRSRPATSCRAAGWIGESAGSTAVLS